MAQSPCFTPLAISLLLPFHFPFTYLETLLWCDAILSTLAPGYSWTDLPFPIPSPIPSPFQIPDPLGFSWTKCAPYYDDIAIPASKVRNKYVFRLGPVGPNDKENQVKM